MNTAGKLTAFAAAVAVAFGGAMAVGAAVGPIDVGDAAQNDMGRDIDTDAALPSGLAIAQDGYRLAVETTIVASGAAAPFTFEILDDTGSAVTEFDELHERELHLIVLSRNLVDYAHVHPTRDDAGMWSVELPALVPGSYRVFADFQPAGGDNLTLGTDLVVPGALEASDVPAPTSVDEVDGYTVTLAGTPRPGDTELRFVVELAGEPIRTEPYLGAAGHLVAIRSGDLAYLHVHPEDDPTSTTVTFTADFPTAGTFRLFFDFAHEGTVRTASFTVDVPATNEGGDQPADPPAAPQHEGH